jgi:hypothetical protein
MMRSETGSNRSVPWQGCALEGVFLIVALGPCGCGPVGAVVYPGSADAYLLTLHYRDYMDGSDVGVLGVLQAGTVVPWTEHDTCGIVADGADVLAFHSDQAPLMMTMRDTFVYDLTGTCEADVDMASSSYKGNMLAVTDGEVRTGDLATCDDDCGPYEQDARSRLEAAAGGAAVDFKPVLESRRFTAGEWRYVVVEAALVPAPGCTSKRCEDALGCGPDVHMDSGVYVYPLGDQTMTPALARTQTFTDPDAWPGSVSLVDFLVLDPESPPWIVLYQDNCECWEFELLAPDMNGTSFTTVKVGAGSCTI